MSGAFRRTTFSSDAFTGVVGSSYTKQAAAAGTYLSAGLARVFPAHRDRYDPDDPQGMNIVITATPSGNDFTFTVLGNPVDGLTREIKGGYWVLMNDPSVFLTVANEALIQSLMTALSALGGGTVTVEGGLGAITCTTGLTAKNNVTLDMSRPGTWLQGVNGVNPLSYSATGPSSGQTFTGTVSENAIGGTLSGAITGLAVGDLVQITRTADAFPIQFMRVKTLATSVTPTFESSFAWPYTTAYDVRRVATRLQNFKFRGEIRGTGTTGACRGIDIAYFEDLDLSEVITRDFAGNVNSNAITVTKGFGLRMPACRDYDGAGGGNYAAYQLSSISDWKVTTSSSYTRGGQPFFAAAMVDGYMAGNVWTGGGRTCELDAISRLRVFGDVGTNSGIGGGTGLSIESGAASVTETRHLSFYGVKYTNCSSYGLETFGGGATDIHFYGCDFRGNNIGTGNADIGLIAGDDDIYLHDTRYDTISIGVGVNVYIDQTKISTVTPSIIQSVTLTTVAATIADVTRHGKRIFGDYLLTVTTPGVTANNNDIEVTLPQAAKADRHTNFAIVGTGTLFDNSTGFIYPFIAVASNTTNRAKLLPASLAGAVPAFLGNANSGFNVALAADDIIKIKLDYEAA